MKQDLIELFKRTIDLEDPDRQYIGFLADKCMEIFQEQYKQGVEDALFDPLKHSPFEIRERNERIAGMHKEKK